VNGRGPAGARLLGGGFLSFGVTIRIERSADALVAAGIWARATAERDGSPSASLARCLPGVRRRLAEGGLLDIAYRGDVAVGFTVLVGRELVYLAVDPAAWGGGVAGRLLAHVDEVGIRSGFDSLELWVIAANERAVGVYTRAGWVPTEHVKESGGRTERRLVKRFAGASSAVASGDGS
jgi:GNAT superfamily N-acetyltransferase